MDFLSNLFVDFGAQILSTVTAAFAIAAIGLNVHFGYTGLLNIGQAGFMLLGAYGYAITVRSGAPFWVGVLVALAAAALFALILGIPTLKLRGDYLAIVTIAAAEIVRIVGGNQSLANITGGVAGINNQTYSPAFTALSPFSQDGTFSLGPYTYPTTVGDSWFLRIVCWVVLALVALLVALLMKSPWGRTIRGIREDEDAARSLGKNVYLYKMQALVLGGVIGAIGGVLYVLASSVQPDSLGRSTTFLLYTIVLLGGAATVLGPVLGSAAYFIIIIGLQDVVSQFVPAQIMSQQQIPQFGWIVVGVGLMLLVIFRPQGVLGNKKELSFGD
jgi:neutral amino acid transport system permease protein